jgi:DNA-binding LytR/AlgR family response regulator
MSAPIQLLLIEDEAVLALDLRATLRAEGYEVVGIASTGPQALALFERHPGIGGVLCDIHLQGPWDGIDTARRLLAVRPVPLIYLTALADQPTLDRALTTQPAAYLPKPVSAASLRAALALALHTVARPVAPGPTPAAPLDALTRDTILQRDDFVFIKDGSDFVRIPLADILLLEADNTYTIVRTPTRKHALRLTLGAVLERLHFAQLVRVHRSFAVNIQRVERFSDAEATVAGQIVPLGRQYREAFLKQFLFR